MLEKNYKKEKKGTVFQRWVKNESSIRIFTK